MKATLSAVALILITLLGALCLAQTVEARGRSSDLGIE